MNPKTPLFVGFEGLEPDWKAYKSINPLGIVLFQRNLESLEQVVSLCDQIHVDLPGTVIAIDQEGGRVNRLSHLLPAFPAPPAWGSPDISFRAGQTMGLMLQALHIDMNFAPAVDLDYGEEDNALQGRLLGSNIQKVVAQADAYLQGLSDSGCMGCLKHFPGLGTTRQDSHFFLSEYNGDHKSWIREEGAIYKQLLGRKWSPIPVMLAHCVIPFWENQVASSSARAVSALRSMGSTGLLLTDDLEMKAVPEKQIESFCQSSLSAGVDALMVCRSLELAQTLSRLLTGFPNDAQKKLMMHKDQCQLKKVDLAEAITAWGEFSSSV